MAYEIGYEERGDYLYVRMSGDEAYEDALRFWKGLKKVAEKKGYTRFLIVDKVKGVLPTIQVHNLSKEVASLFRGMAVAYVDPKDDTFEANRYGETVVSNRGVNARVFRTEAEAVKWLSHQQKAKG